MSDPLDTRSVEAAQHTVQQVQLRDGGGDDPGLVKCLDRLAKEAGRNGERRQQMLAILKSVAGYLWWPAAVAVAPLRWAIEMFTAHEERMTRVRAEAGKLNAEAAKLLAQAATEEEIVRAKGLADAEKTRAEAEKARAEADKLRAEADKLRAEAENKRAEAARAVAEAGTADEMRQRLISLGVIWERERTSDGRLRFVVGKEPLPDDFPTDTGGDEPARELPPKS